MPKSEPSSDKPTAKSSIIELALPVEKKAKIEPAKGPKVVEPQDANIDYHKIMLTLLKDIYSVDVCFVIESDETCSNVGLWAHRAILSRYKGFQDVIQTACKTIPSTSEDMANLTIGDDYKSSSSTTAQDDDILGPLLIPVEKLTLPTLCVLLRYIYTGQINLSAEADKHAISTTESTLVLQGIMSGRKESVRWHPLKSDSLWKFKDVTWEELLLASDYYGVMDLRSRCEKEVISAMKQPTVVETLFTTGCSFYKIKDSGLNYIVDNMTSLFSKGKDPFALYKNHPECHDMMIEIFHRKIAKG
ncbi:hypothetical protein BGX26_001990 [Mortierella sp. AD094]|nr:hypothetical protein BGX26_001990 [Mortierella sp. AD094]